MTTPRILITGKRGQVGWELERSCSILGEVLALDSAQLDLKSQDAIVTILRNFRPNILINAAAHTAVDRAESETLESRLINSVAPGIMAEECKRLGAFLVHFSTDYVFDGTKSLAYVESDEPNPLGVYGQTKREGEIAISQVLHDYLIFRVSWVYSHRGNNFLRKMLELGRQREELRVVSDQEGTPTWARFLAETVSHILYGGGHRKNPGLYHLVPDGETNWFEFSKKVLEAGARRGLVAKMPLLSPIPSAQYPTPAKRPANSRLNNRKVKETFHIGAQHWEKYMELCLDSL